MAQSTFLDEQFAVDQRAVGAAEVADVDVGAVDAQQAMLAADQLAVRADVALGAAAHNELALGEIQERSVGLSLHDLHLHRHDGILSQCRIPRLAGIFYQGRPRTGQRESRGIILSWITSQPGRCKRIMKWKEPG